MGAVVTERDALQMIDELRKRGAVEVEVPIAVAAGIVGTIRAKFANVDPVAAPKPPKAKPAPTPEEIAAAEDAMLFASADPSR